jgi:type VI secretion system protein ImpM
VTAAGFCGKLPARADFVARRLSPLAVEAWHAWLAEALAATRTAMGDDWLDAFLHGPIWRFALPPGLIGAQAMAGTLTPSVDSVGRYFPLSIMLPLPSVAALAGFAATGEDWFAAAEAVSLRALKEGVDLEDVDAGVVALPAPEPQDAPRSGGRGALGNPGVVIPLEPESDGGKSPTAAFGFAHLSRGDSLWWTLGSDRVEPAAVLAAALPAPAAFAAFLSGNWAMHGWHEGERRHAGDEALP